MSFDAEKVVNEIKSNGGSAIAVQGDVSKSADVKRLFEETEKAFGRLDILVNNAGIYWAEPLEDFEEDSFRKMFDINVLGTLLTSQESLKLFDDKGGSIINISSIVSKDAPPTLSVYAASKAAMSLITNVLSKELAPKNIRVNSLLPGMILTEGQANIGLVPGNPFVEMMIGRTALGRLATPEDIGNMAVFLATEEANIITGQEVEISGGFQ